MNCGMGLQSPSESLSEWFSFIGLGKDEGNKEEEVSTPSTVISYHDDDDATSAASASASSRQLNFTCMAIPSTENWSSPVNTEKRPKFHRPCNPNTCRMTSGMCVDCAQCLNHCVCGDNAKLLPATCDTPDCSHIVCSDCMRCQTHCTCYNDPNLLAPIHTTTRNSDYQDKTAISSGMISFSEASIKIPPHQSSIKIKKASGNNNNSTSSNTSARTKKQQQQQDDLGMTRTRSLWSNNSNDSDSDSDDDDDDSASASDDDENGSITKKDFVGKPILKNSDSDKDWMAFTSQIASIENRSSGRSNDDTGTAGGPGNNKKNNTNHRATGKSKSWLRRSRISKT